MQIDLVGSRCAGWPGQSLIAANGGGELGMFDVCPEPEVPDPACFTFFEL